MPFPTIASPPAIFPTYLVSSLPFRRRQSSIDSTGTVRSNSISSTLSTSPPNSSFPTTGGEGEAYSFESEFLSSHGSHLRCARCAADLAHSSQIISKGFTGRHGRAYLVAPSAEALRRAAQRVPDVPAPTSTAARNAALPNLPNTHVHRPVPRTLVTGAHTVGDISCAHCGAVLGWKYVAAEEEGQRYKVGKFILETKRVCKSSTWEGESGGTAVGGALAEPPSQMPSFPDGHAGGGGGDDGVVEFDSQDEDECEDLFLGVWTPQLAAKRRRQKRFTCFDEED